MRLFTRFLVRCVLIAVVALPLIAIASPQRKDSSEKRETPERSADDGKAAKGAKAEQAKNAPKGKADSKGGADRIEPVRSRMKARDKEIDRIMNKDKKR